MGEQRLYRARGGRASTSASATIELDDYRFVVNGVPMPIRGWNWVPLDVALRRAAAGEARAPARARRARERQPAARVGRRPDRDARVLRALRPARAPRLAGVHPVELRHRERAVRRSGVRRDDGRGRARRSCRGCGAIRRSRSGAAATSSTATTRRRCSRALRDVVRELDPGARVAADLAARRATDVHGPWEHQGLRAHNEHYDTRTVAAAQRVRRRGDDEPARARGADRARSTAGRADRTNPVYEHLGAWWNNAPLVQEAFGGRIARRRDDAAREPVAAVRRAALRGRGDDPPRRRA